jgi:hypothetical protein
MEAPVLPNLPKLLFGVILLLLPAMALAQGVTPTREQAGPALTALQLIDDMIHASDAAVNKAALIGCQFDDTTPGTTTENNVRPVRCSTLRELYGIIRDAAGNARGANVNASNELLVSSNTEFGTASSTPNAGTYAAPTAPEVWAFLMCKSGSTYDPCVAAPNIAHDAAAAAANPMLMGGYANATPPADVSTDVDAVRAWFLRDGAQVTATIDPCSQKAKLFIPISQTTGTQLFAGTASNRTYVCSVHVVSATAQNIALVSGTGTVCATSTGAMAGGTTAATGWNFAANGGLVLGNGSATVAKSDTDADNICILMSSTGQLSGTLSYVVAPN